MARWCAVKGCAQKKRIKKGDSLYKLPAIIKHSDVAAQKMSERRRIKWLARINRKDLGVNQLRESRSTLSVCSRHFVSGKPSGLFDNKSPDWAPSLYLGNGRDGDDNGRVDVVRTIPDPPVDLDMDCVAANPLPVYDEMDCVTNEEELSKQKAKLKHCTTKLKSLLSQRDTLIGKLECLQVLANIDLDLLHRTIDIATHPEAKEDWNKLYCLVMTIKGEDEMQKLIRDDDVKISDVEDEDDEKTNGRSLRNKVQKKKRNTRACQRSVAVQCQEKKKKMEAMGVQTDINIFTKLPDLMPKDKEQVYLVLDYGKDDKVEPVVKVTGSSDGSAKQGHGVLNDSSMLRKRLSTDSCPNDATLSRPDGQEVDKISGVSQDIVNTVPVTAGQNHQPTEASIPSIWQSHEHHKQQSMGTAPTMTRLKDASLSKLTVSHTPDISIPDFSTGPMDLLASIEECHQPVEVLQPSMVDKELEDDMGVSPTTTTNPPALIQGRKYVSRRCRGVYERKVVIKKIQHPFLVQSPQNSTALVMSNSNRGGQNKVFRRKTICKICGKVFPSMMDQMLHARIEHLGKKVYECEVCRKKFSYNNDLRRHMIMHTKQKNFQCAECGKTFVSNPGLVSHIESVHKGVRHRCEICGQVYNRKNSLRIHMAGKHNVKNQETILPAAIEQSKEPDLLDLDQHMSAYSGHLL